MGTPPPCLPTELAERLDSIRAVLELALETSDVDHRPSRQRVRPSPLEAAVGACSSCKSVKSKCEGIAPERCPRCIAHNKVCEYPVHARRGRKKASTPTTQHLHRALGDLDKLLGGAETSRIPLSVPSQPPAASSSQRQPQATPFFAATSPSSTDSSPDDDLALDISNPLAMLAKLSLEENYKPEAGSSDSGKGAPDGLYETRSDADPFLDPVYLGILTEADLDRLINLYFDHLYQFYWSLVRGIHTPIFLRLNSPFLTTVLAATAASYCPLSGHLCKPLTTHATYLANRAFSEGFKSYEVVLAYDILTHWAQPPDGRGRDRSWILLGQALRIATEIRMDLPLKDSQIALYNLITPLKVEQKRLMVEDRARTWSFLFVSEIIMAVQTGRIQSILGFNLAGGFRAKITPPNPSDINYNIFANETLYRVYAKALILATSLREEVESDTVRPAFNASWTADFVEWDNTWASRNNFVTIQYLNCKIMLLTTSLQFKGERRPIFDQCESLALASVRTVIDWSQEYQRSLAYVNNFIIINIAYAATLLIKLSSISASGGVLEIANVRAQCHQISAILASISAARLNGSSFASLHSARINVLLKEAELADIQITPTTSTLDQSFIPYQQQMPIGGSSGMGEGYSDPFGEGVLADDFLDALIHDPMFHFDLNATWDQNATQW